MLATAERTMECPGCGTPMLDEGRAVLDFNGGRGRTEVERFRCSGCQVVYNVPLEGAGAEND